MVMSMYERVASRLIGTPLQRPAEWLRRVKGSGFRRAHPELGEIFLEPERVDRVMHRKIGADTNCIDIGCHLGAYLQKMVTLAPRGRHLALEPVPDKAEWLRRKFPSVAVVEAAADDSDGMKEFFIDPAQTALSGLRAGSREASREALRVRCRQLDDIVDEGARVGFVKVDVNGGELPALRGARRLLRRERPFVLLGCSQRGLDDHGIDAGELFKFVVVDVGYQIFLLKDYLNDGSPLDAAAFRESMVYPFKAFKYALSAT